MPIRRKPEEAVQFLLNRLDDAKKRANSNDIELSRWFQRIENELQKMEDLFPKFKHCEETLMHKFTDLERQIDDNIFDDGRRVNEIENIIDQIKELVSQIKLPSIDETPTLSQQRDLLEDRARMIMTEDWYSLNVEENVMVSAAMASLQQSYDALELQLKLCLLCLAIFPEKSVIKKRPLIYWWIGEGLVSKSKEKNAEKVGEAIFVDLIEKGLIQPVYKNRNPLVDSCTVHPWIRRMLISVAKKAEFFDINSTGTLANDFSRSRRACLAQGNQGFSGRNNSSNEEEMLTLFNINEQYLSVKADWFSKLKKTVILQLGRWQNKAKHHIEVENDDFLNGLGALKHLKYLSLQGISRITALPPSLVELINLEILDLRACHNLEKLPSDIASLRKLTHLDVSECYLLESMPKGLEKLTFLQVLKGFVIGGSRKSPCKLGDLIQLKRLRKLSIYIGSESVIEEVELVKLKEITTLRVLTITWGQVSLQSKRRVQPRSASLTGVQLNRTATLTMQSFSFPPELEKLDLWCFPDRVSPEWLRPSSLENLKKLYIRGGGLDSLVPEENKKWKVKILRLKYLKNLKVELDDLRNEFPDLDYFERIRCHQISESEYSEDIVWSKAEA